MEKKKQDMKIIVNDEMLPADIPVEGSLGLLALGAVGITEWRKVRDAHTKKTRKN
jgi:hypothetical protein